jgi:hypothetical protein
VTYNSFHSRKLLGIEGVGRRGRGQGGEMTQALYAHINNKRKKQSNWPLTGEVIGFVKKKKKEKEN